MAIIPFAEWMPDQTPLGSSGAVEAKGVYPRTAGTYGPLATLSAVTDALTARCQGAYSARKGDDGVIYTFAGDATKLYRLDGGSSWVDVSDGTYATGDEERWNFVQYGDRVIVANINTQTKQFNLSSFSASTNVSQLSATAPQARHAAIIRDFVVLANTYDSSDGYVPNRVWWSGIDDPTNWPTPGTAAAVAVQSDFQDIPTGGWVQGIVGPVGGVDGLVFTETSIWRMTYEGPPTIFRFDEVERARGTPAPGSIVNVGDFAAYLSDDGFYVTRGGASEPIGASRVDKWFFADLDQTYYSRITATADPLNKLVIWSYCSGATGSVPDKVIIWNWQLNRWSHADLACQMVFRARTSGYTLEGLDAVSASIDALSLSLDSRVWTGGRLVLAGFDTDNRLAYLTGSNQAATITTAESGGDRRIYITGVRPMIDGGTVTCEVSHRITQDGALTTSVATSAGADGYCPQRIATRYARVTANIAAGGSWTHAQGVEVRMRGEGMR